jgi:hypothetical protein
LNRSLKYFLNIRQDIPIWHPYADPDIKLIELTDHTLRLSVETKSLFGTTVREVTCEFVKLTGPRPQKIDHFLIYVRGDRNPLGYNGSKYVVQLRLGEPVTLRLEAFDANDKQMNVDASWSGHYTMPGYYDISPARGMFVTVRILKNHPDPSVQVEANGERFTAVSFQIVK